MTAAIAERDGEVLYVRGKLDFDSVAHLWNATESLFATCPPAQIDLGGVGHANSAGVALLVEWLGWTHRSQRELAFINVPAQMRAIIEVAGLETILPLAE